MSRQPISSEDPQAVPKLKEKLATLEAWQATMKQVNAAYRTKGTAALDELLTPECAATVRRHMATTTWEKKPFPGWELQNNNANIKRIKGRIAELESQADRADVREVFDTFTYRLDAADNRVRFVFDDIPSPETRTLLKRHGFKWAPSAGAWQRQATQNGVNTAEYLKTQLRAKQAA